MQNQSVCEIVREAEENYTTGKTTISKYVEHSLYLTIEKIIAYLNSTHVNGRFDSLNRIKPFFNVVIAAVNIWYRATDTDRKNIRLKAKNTKQQLNVFLANALLQDFMRTQNFGKFLNSWGITEARFGSAVPKFVEKENKLHCEVVPWNRLIVDAIDFENNVIIEKLWFTPAQLRKNKSYNQDFVKELIDSVGPRKTMDNIQKDNKSGYIEVYEVHGELPLSLLKKAQGKKTTEKDDDVFIQQMHVVSFIAKKKPDTDETYYDEYTLYAGKEKKSPYMITHLIEEEDRTLGKGAVEYLFESQWMINHTAKQIKDQLDLASKQIYQTADGNLAGQNVLKNIQSGDILKHVLNSPMTRVQNDADIASVRMFKNDWQLLSKDITSTPEAFRGETMPAGTAYRQVVALQQQAGSLFEIMTENKALDLERMLREFIIPYLKKKMDTSEEVAAILSDYDIKQIDARYIPNEVIRRSNRKLINKVMAGEMITPDTQGMIQAEEDKKLRDELGIMGNQRFLKPSDIETKTWKEALKDFEWDVEIEIANENIDKQAVFANLNAILQTVANPQFMAFLQTDDGRVLFNRLLTETGVVSPLEMSFKSPMPSMANPGINTPNQNAV